MVPSKVKVSFEGVNRLYTYFNDEFDLTPGDVVYVEGKMWNKPGQVKEVVQDDSPYLGNSNKVVQLVNLEIHGTYYSYGPYMFCFDQEGISFEQFRSWVSPPRWRGETDAQGGFSLKLDELGYCDFVSERTLEYGVKYFEKERVEYISNINGKGHALVRDEHCHNVAFHYNRGMISNMVCQSDHVRFCAHDVAVCLTLQSLLAIFHREFSKEYDGVNFTAVNRSLFYKIAAYSLKKISL